MMAFLESIYLSLKAALNTGQVLRVVKITSGLLVSSMLVFTVAGTLVQDAKTFTISLLPSTEEGHAQISLCETEDFASPTTALDAGGFPQMNNISQYWLPEDLNEYEGSHNGENYLAYSFYVKNTGDAAGILSEQINLNAGVLGAEAAVRLRLYRNGEPTTYALMGADGNPEEGTEPFGEDGVIVSHETESFEPGAIIKYTLVIWLEGDDPECLDNIKGGQVRMSMCFSVRDQKEA